MEGYPVSSVVCERYIKSTPEDMIKNVDKIGFRTKGLAKQSIYGDTSIHGLRGARQVVVKLTIIAEIVEDV